MEPKKRNQIQARARKLRAEIIKANNLGCEAEDFAHRAAEELDDGRDISGTVKRLNHRLAKLHRQTDRVWATAQELTAAVASPAGKTRAGA